MLNNTRFCNRCNIAKIALPVFIFVIFFSIITIAQYPFSSQQFPDYQFDHLSSANGLSFDHTNWITKDKQGFIWIATDDGLNKFDGINFKIYRHDERNFNSPINNRIVRIAPDSKGNIWMSSDGGVIEYFPTTDSFKNYPVTAKSKNNSTSALYIDAKDVVWFGNDDGLCSLNNEGKIEIFVIEHLWNRFSISSIIEDKEGILWLGTLQGLYSFNKTTHKFQQFLFEKFSNGSNIINYVFQDHEKNIWVGTWGGGLGKFNKYSGTFQMYTYNKSQVIDNRINIILNIYESPKDSNTLWIGTDEAGICIFDKKTMGFTFAKFNENDFHAFNANGVNQIFDDQLGTLWFATNKGVVKLDSYQQQFQSNKFEPSESSVHSSYITKIIVDTISSPKAFWISTYGSGLVRYEPQTGKYAAYIPGNSNTKGSEDVNDFFQDKRGIIWITTENGIYEFNPKIKSFITDKNILENPVLPHKRFRNIIQSDDGKLWISIPGNGFCSFDPTKKSFKWFNKISDVNNDSINKSVFCLTIDHKGNIWGGTQFGGMFLFNPNTEKYTIYNLKNNFTNHGVYSIVETDNQEFWIAAYNGLWHFNPVTKKFTRYTTGNGLPNDICYNIIEDDNHLLWITTLNGLSVFDPAKGTFKNYSTNDGLFTNNLNVSFNKGFDGKFYLGIDNRFNFFNPNYMYKNNRPPPIAFTSFRIFGKEIRLPEINTADIPLQLNYQQNMLSFEFAGLNFTVPQKNQYAYKLEGADKDWSYSGTRRQATYSNLSGGDYIFHVKAANNDGVWNEEGKHIYIHISPPFWKTWWFQILAASAIISAIYLFYRRRIAYIRQEEKRKTIFNQQLAQLEMKALKAQMNPHFIFNCMNSINSYILENDKKNASDYLTKFSTLIRLILENSDKQKINLADELAMLETYIQLEQNRLDNKFDYLITIDPFLKTTTFEIPSLIIQPFVENAIWHGLAHKKERGKITISIRKELNCLFYIIEDNGIGRSKAATIQQQQLIKHQSLGMKVTEDRLRLLAQLKIEKPFVNIVDLFNENNEPCGTRSEITIPV